MAGMAKKVMIGNKYQGQQLGRILVDMGKVKRANVHEALEIQKERKEPIGKILVDLGYVTEEDVFMACQLQILTPPGGD